MRTLTTEVAGLPAGTEYEIYEDLDGIRRAAWMQPYPAIFGSERVTVLRASARVDGKGSLAAMTAAGPLYDAHVAALGINPEELIPCANCGAELAACLTLCANCKCDPDADVPCGDCDRDGAGDPSGYISVSTTRSGMMTYDTTCPVCHGDKTVPGVYAAEREAATAAAKRWAAGQRAEAVPAGIGTCLVHLQPEPCPTCVAHKAGL